MADFPPIVGVAGYSGSGKTSVGRMLGTALSLPVMHLSDPLKKIVNDMDPYDSNGTLVSTFREMGGEAAVKDMHDRYRHTLRAVGEGVRKIDRTFWMRALWARSIGHRGVIVPDIRHPEDADECAILIHVSRPGITSDGHDTERDMSLYASHRIVNDGTLTHLAVKVDRLIGDLELEGAESNTY